MADQREYRVRWRREDHRRAHTMIFQSRPPAARRVLILEGRLAEAFPSTNPDDLACCSGGPYCDCGGKTVAEAWAERHEQFPPLVEGPTIESRKVGEWEVES